MKIDFGLTAVDYGECRLGFPDSFFERLLDFEVGTTGQRLVDIGTGTGTLARSFAARGCSVIGIDPSKAMIDEATRLTAAAGLEADYRVATAEETNLADTCCEVVVAGQCWHWFDRPRAALEVARILTSAGRLVVGHFDWIPLPGNLVEGTEELIEAHNPNWKLGGGMGMHPWILRDLGIVGFRDIETFSYDFDAPYSHEAWRGRVRASAGIGASLPAPRIEAFDRDLAAMLCKRAPDETLAIPHRVFAVIARPPAP